MQLVGRLVAVVLAFRQAALDRPPQRWRKIRPQAGKRLGRVRDDRGRREDGRSTLERTAPGEELVHDDAERELIGPEVHLFAGRLLRRHVLRRAHDQPGVGAERRPLPVVFEQRQLRQAEVQHLQVAVGPDHDVLGLDVAVHDAAPVSGRERAGHLRADIDRLTDGDGPAVHLLPQRLPRDELGDDERAAVDLADVVDHEDVGMVERRGRPRLRRESGGSARDRSPPPSATA